jgi:hypothetical protein
MVLRLPRLTVKIAFDDQEILLTGVFNFLLFTVIAGHDDDTPGVPLLPTLSSLGSLPRALDGDLGWVFSTAACGCFCVAQDEGGSNCLLAECVLSGNAKYLFGTL